MASKLILQGISSIIILTGAFTIVGGQDVEQQILESTLMISIIVPDLEPGPEADEAPPIPRDEFRAIAKPETHTASDGLATVLVNPNGEWIMLTHDHWTVLNGDLGTVEIRNSRNQIVAELELWEFKRLIRHRNGGTMVLTAPDEIASRLDPEHRVSPGRFLGNHNITPGDQVNLVYRKRDGRGSLAVRQVEVESVELKQGLPVVRLSSSAGLPVIGGDSGGGIWLDGQLVANTWTTIMVTNPETGTLRPTHSSIAAVVDPVWTE